MHVLVKCIRNIQLNTYEEHDVTVHVASMRFRGVEAELGRCWEEHAGVELPEQRSGFPLGRSQLNCQSESIQLMLEEVILIGS